MYTSILSVHYPVNFKSFIVLCFLFFHHICVSTYIPKSYNIIVSCNTPIAADDLCYPSLVCKLKKKY